MTVPNGGVPLADAVREAWDEVLAAAAGAGYEVARLVNVPATPAQVEAAERAIGRRLPRDLVELYLLSDGQRGWSGPVNAAAGVLDRGRGRWLGPLFGAGWEFDSLDELVKQYRVWADVRAPHTPEQLTEEFDEYVQVRSGDPVKRAYTHEAWVPFATDGGGNSLAVDLEPEPGGDVGQVIVIGSDEDLRRVLAASVLELLRLCAERLRYPVDDLYVSDGVAMYTLESGNGLS